MNEPQHSNNKRINNNQSSNNYGNHSSNRQSRSLARSNSSYNHVDSQAQSRAPAVAQKNLARETNRMISSFQNVTIAHVDEDSSSEENHLGIYVEQGEIEVNSNKAPVLDKQAVAEKPKERHKEYLSSNEGCDEDAIPAYAVARKDSAIIKCLSIKWFISILGWTSIELQIHDQCILCQSGEGQA